jgi:hypothetical protein
LLLLNKIYIRNFFRIKTSPTFSTTQTHVLRFFLSWIFWIKN